MGRHVNSFETHGRAHGGGAAFLLRAKGFEEKSLKSRARGKTNDNFDSNFACLFGTVIPSPRIILDFSSFLRDHLSNVIFSVSRMSSQFCLVQNEMFNDNNENFFKINLNRESVIDSTVII